MNSEIVLEIKFNKKGLVTELKTFLSQLKSHQLIREIDIFLTAPSPLGKKRKIPMILGISRKSSPPLSTY